MKSAFEEATSKYPGYYQLYDIMLRTLEPKWSGSVGAMVAFVDQYAGHAAAHSPLKLLFLSLYRDLLDSASVACNSVQGDRDKMAQCVASGMRSIVTPKLESEVAEALQL